MKWWEYLIDSGRLLPSSALLNVLGEKKREQQASESPLPPFHRKLSRLETPKLADSSTFVLD